MADNTYYQPSNKSSLLGFILALCLGIIVAIGVAFVYNSFIIIMPIIYLNLLTSIGFGVILGYCAKFFARLGKIRNKKDVILLAVLLGFIGFYLQWIAYFSYLTSGEHSFQNYEASAYLIYNPDILLSVVLQLNKTGSWGLFGATFNGWALWLVWIIEAALIIGAPLIIAIYHPIIPYSEILNKWYSKRMLNYQFQSIAARNQFCEEIAAMPENTISALTYGSAHRFSEVSIYYLKDEEAQYLSVDNILIGDKAKRDITPVVHLLKIDNKTAHNLMQKFGYKKQFILNY